MTYGFVGMQTIDVQKINGAVLKFRERIVEASPQEIRELPIIAIVVLVDVIEDFFAIAADVLVSLPLIDGVTRAGKLLLFNRLAEGEIGFTPVGAQFDQKTRLYGRDQIIGEGQMTGPAAHISRLVTAWEKLGWQ